MNQEITQPIDERLIAASLDLTATFYECNRRDCRCGRGKEAIGDAVGALDDGGIDATTARAFAHGIAAAQAIHVSADPEAGTNNGVVEALALLLLEALRRAGDVTDAQINEACDQYRSRLNAKLSDVNVNRKMPEIVAAMRERFDMPVAPGSERSN